MTEPLVSIVVPIYKVEAYLERCLDSIVHQVYRPLEVILVNDGSPDGCGDIIRRYEAMWPFIQSIWQENSGLGAARNAGIARATGKYLALVDSDDYIEPDFIRNLVRRAEQNDADVVICNFYLDFPNGMKLPYQLYTLRKSMSGEKAAKTSLKLWDLPVFAWNKLYRLDLFTNNGITYPSMYYEDVAITWQILSKAKKVSITRKPYYHYCLRSTGITGNFGMKNITDYLKAVDSVRRYLWTENLWDSWQRTYSLFVLTVKTQLYFDISLRRNSIPPRKRRAMRQYVSHRMQVLSLPPYRLSRLGDKRA